MLANHLQRIAILLLEKPLKKMKTMEIWLEHKYPELSAMQYHPGAKCLIDHAYDPRLKKKVRGCASHREPYSSPESPLASKNPNAPHLIVEFNMRKVPRRSRVNMAVAKWRFTIATPEFDVIEVVHAVEGADADLSSAKGFVVGGHDGLLHEMRDLSGLSVLIYVSLIEELALFVHQRSRSLERPYSSASPKAVKLFPERGRFSGLNAIGKVKEAFPPQGSR